MIRFTGLGAHEQRCWGRHPAVRSYALRSLHNCKPEEGMHIFAGLIHSVCLSALALCGLEGF